MSGFNRARDRLFDQLPRRSCLAEQPIRDGEVDRSSDAGIMAEPELGLAIAFGIEYPQRLLGMGSGRGEIALKEASHARGSGERPPLPSSAPLSRFRVRKVSAVSRANRSSPRNKLPMNSP